jgi:hypothetical protein
VIAGAVVSMWGCSAEPKASAPPVQASIDQPKAVEPGQEPVDSRLSAMTAQAERDVEAILQSRASARTEAGQAGAPSLPGPVSAAAIAVNSGPRRILWNDAAYLGAASKIAEPAVHQPPLARASMDHAPLEVAASRPAGEPATAPVALPPGTRVEQCMVDLSRELYASAAYSEAPLRELAAITAMTMIDSGRRLDPAAIPDLNEAEREALGHLQSFFADLGAGLKAQDDPEQAIAAAVGNLRDALVDQPHLTLPTIAFCSRVGGFGDYTAFERNSFLSGGEQKLIVYLEIDDFTSQLNPNMEHVTELAQQLTIYSDRDGIPVWKEDWQSAIDVSKNQRQDFFTVQVITLPKALSVGKYQLKVRVRDEKSKAEAEGSVPFEMVADPRMAVK